MTALVTFGRGTIPALVFDVSSRGLQLRGDELPAAGAWATISMILPPREVSVVGHVMWNDRARGAIGVALGPASSRHHREVRAAMLALCFERSSEQSAAIVFVDDPRVAVRLCAPLRRHGYLPCVVATPLDAAACLERARPPVRIAIILPHAVGLPAAELVDFLEAEYPSIPRILIGGPRAPNTTDADEALALANELDERLEQLVS